MNSPDSQRIGTFYALTAYSLWGVVPLYWHLLKAFSATELIAHRILWAFVFYLFLSWMIERPNATTSNSRFPAKAEWFFLLTRRHTGIPLFFAGVLLTLNWLIYVWAVNTGHIIESSLGYFITPLFNVLMGALILKEKLSRAHQVAAGLATIGVVMLSAQSDGPPWIALSLALSFSIYGFIRKKLDADVIHASTAETAVVLLPAFAWIIFSRWFGGSAHDASAGESTLLFMTGILTGVPLLCFAQAARRLPLSILGFFQYIAPTIQFLIGRFAFNEPFSESKFHAFVVIWLGLAIFSFESIWKSIRKSIA